MTTSTESTKSTRSTEPDHADHRGTAVERQETALTSPVTRRVLATLRIAVGLTFLWAFVDKVFGFGYATPADGAWLDGGSPTEGFLANAATGPFADFYHSIAGDAWADWLFMLGLFGIGLALTLGLTIRLAGFAGALLYLMMWSVVLPPENNPVLDDHILGAITSVLFAVALAGDTWGVGRAWADTDLVRKFPVLR